MAVLQMQRISICALKSDRKAVLEKIQSMGVIEVSHKMNEEPDFHTMDTARFRGSFEKATAVADQALIILNRYAPLKQSIFSSLEGKTLVDQEKYQLFLREKERLLQTAKTIQTLDKERAELKASILKIENHIESLKPWLSLGVSVTCGGTERTVLLAGTLPGQLSLEGAYAMLTQQSQELNVDMHIISADQSTTYLVVLCLREAAEAVEEALRGMGFSRSSQALDKVPVEAKAEMEVEISKLQSKIKEIEQEIIQLAVHRDGLELLADYYRIRGQKYEVLGQISQSERTFFISGYVPKRQIAKLRNILEGQYDCVLDVEELKEGEEPPVALKNNEFSSSTQGILEAFGLPSKGEVDPTAIMSFFYVFLFGLMLSDAAYGIIVSVVCSVLLLKFPRMDVGMRKSFQLFFWCGLSTLFWGVMFGGYFGDVVQVVSSTFFGTKIDVPALWFVPLEDPMKLLIYCMMFGVIHLFVGLGVKGYMCLSKRKYMDFFCDVVLWYMLLTGLLIMLLPSEMFVSISQMSIVFPPVVSALGKWLAILGTAGIFLMSGRGHKNLGLRLALGAYDLYNVSGWLSDILSYSRLLALGLATGVIASVVNQMGSLGGKSIQGAIMFIIAFVFGHTFNICINLLGAYVHTNRLQFVEFFGKFYEGGGRAFNPFKENTKYTDIKEETKI